MKSLSCLFARKGVLHSITKLLWCVFFIVQAFVPMHMQVVMLLYVLLLCNFSLCAMDKKVELKITRSVMTVAISVGIIAMLVRYVSVWATGGGFVIDQLQYALSMCFRTFLLFGGVSLFVCSVDPSAFVASLSRLGVKTDTCITAKIALEQCIGFAKQYHTYCANQAKAESVSLFAKIQQCITACHAVRQIQKQKANTMRKAMVLRGFGRHQKRTWYYQQTFSRYDVLVYALMVFCVVIQLLLV